MYKIIKFSLICVSRILLALFFVIFLINPFNKGFAQQKFSFDKLYIDHSISQKKIYAIIQDHKGFLWFGTEQGLVKYDNYNFTHYAHNASDSNSLSNNYVLSICEDKKGFIWIGTSNGLNRFDPSLEKFEHFKHDERLSNGISDNTIWCVFEDRDNKIWVGTNNGLNCINTETRKIEIYKNQQGVNNSLSNNYVWSILEDKQGSLWVGTYDGLNKFDKASKKFIVYRYEEENPLSISNNDIRSIHQDANGNIWIGTYKGLNKYNPNKKGFIRYFYSDKLNSEANKSIRAITSDQYNAIWIATTDGLLRMSGDKNIIQFNYDKKDANSISSNDILCLLEDKSGSLWIGTSNSINKFDPNKERFTHISRNTEDDIALSHNSIWAFHEDTQSNLWIGTSQGLNKYNVQLNQFEKVPSILANSPLIQEHILSITQDLEDNLWIGTYGNGLYKYNSKTQTIWNYSSNEKNDKHLTNDNVWALHFDVQNNKLWIGTYGGLNVIDLKNNTIQAYRNNPKDASSLSNDYVLSISQENDSTLWIGTDNGLNRLNINTGQFYHFKKSSKEATQISNNTIWSILNDARGFLWIGTHGGGLNILDKKNHIFKKIGKKEGLSSEIVYGVIQDDKGNIWMSTQKGISKLSITYKKEDVNSIKIINYDISDGLQGSEFNGGAYYKSHKGEMFFGGNNGFNRFYPDSVKSNIIPPPAAITKLKVFNNEVMVSKSILNNDKNKIQRKNNLFFLNKNISYIDEITLSYKLNVINIEFAALHYAIPEKNRYAYMLEGFENDWNYCSDNKSANYTNLSPGKYVFKVKAANCDGIWNPNPTELIINITPPFWETGYFKIILVLLIIFLGYIIIKYRERNIQRKKRILEAMVNKRTAEIKKQKEEIEKHIEQIALQHDEIKTKNKNITDSIKYALKIQQAILPPESFIKRLLPNSFIFYLPKDIVSGDFYWIRKKENYILFAAVDCTGHGVPGAFMSIVANSLLNQAVNEHNLTTPSEILNFIGEGLNSTLGYYIDEDSNVKDGMDIALCKLNKDSMVLEYAGAFNPLYIISEDELIACGADHQSIEISQKQKNKTFTNNVIQLKRNDIIYIFTDGFIDQFGGDNRKKFLKKNLRQTFLNIHKLPMEQQKSELLEIFNNWRGANDQIDDVLIIGIKI